MFCEKCMRKTANGYKQKERTVSIRGISISVPYKAPICADCGTELYSERVELKILETARGKYRDRTRMLPVEILHKYMVQHHLSVDQMAELAGCAVNDIIAADKGALLDKAIDRKIRKVVSA